MSIEYNPVGVTCNLSCPYCFAAGTPVLLTDGSWKPIEDVQVGDELVSFEEEAKGRKRKFVNTVVKKRIHRKDKLLRIKTEKGAIDCTPDHEWLIGRWGHHYRKPASEIRKGDILYWLADPVLDDITKYSDYRRGWLSGMMAGDGTNGDYINSDKSTISSLKIYSTEQEIIDRSIEYVKKEFNVDLRQVDTEREQNGKTAKLSYAHITRAHKDNIEINKVRDGVLINPEGKKDEFIKGWIAGFFDAEGTKNAMIINRKDEHMIDKAIYCWSRLGFKTTKSQRSDGMWSVAVKGGKRETIRFASICRPALKRKVSIEGKAVTKLGRYPVLSVKKLSGTHDTYDVETESITFIADGFLTFDCYEHPMRDAGNYKKPKDTKKVKEALLKENHNFSIFGGEPLLADPDHLEEMWEFGLRNFGQNGIQTNGVLITDDHIEMFKKYKVHVGISLDGYGELNDSRWAGSLEKTRRETQKTLDNIDKLIEHGIIPSLIITLHAGNARGEKLDKLVDWMLGLDKKGIRHVRLHNLEIDHDDVAAEMAMTPDENYKALITFHELERDQLKSIKFDVFADIRKLLTGDDQSVTCVWNACDPYTTRAVHGVDANGDRHNCGRTNKDGVNWFKASQNGHERQLAIYHTDWKNGGCKGCRFFSMCKGQCCGTGEAADWRNKSEACLTWYRLFEYMEHELLQQGITPTSLHPQREKIEHFMIDCWADGKNTNVRTAIDAVENRRTAQQVPSMIEQEHGDVPHGDDHGDHTDQSLNK